MNWISFTPDISRWSAAVLHNDMFLCVLIFDSYRLVPHRYIPLLVLVVCKVLVSRLCPLSLYYKLCIVYWCRYIEIEAHTRMADVSSCTGVDGEIRAIRKSKQVRLVGMEEDRCHKNKEDMDVVSLQLYCDSD